MRSVLDQLYIKYIEEYTPIWSNKQRYDFYLPNYNLIIEIDGGLGHGKKIHNKSTLNIEQSLEIDNFKDINAQNHGINVIRIDADISDITYMSTQIVVALNDIINLDNINWDICNEFATRNIVKEICEYYEQVKPITPTDIAKHFNIKRRQTVYEYLKKGTKIGWCNYDKIISYQSRELKRLKNNAS
jgi:hypothetical protein